MGTVCNSHMANYSYTKYYIFISVLGPMEDEPLGSMGYPFHSIIINSIGSIFI